MKSADEHNRRIELSDGLEIWGVWDYVRYSTHDSEEARLVAITIGDQHQEHPAQVAHRVCAVMNTQQHPQSAMGYRYDYQAERLSLPRVFEDWTDDYILRIVDPKDAR